ncbi:hypothetical protein L9F63_016328, partial [Diploptera punctata]
MPESRYQIQHQLSGEASAFTSEGPVETESVSYPESENFKKKEARNKDDVKTKKKRKLESKKMKFLEESAETETENEHLEKKEARKKDLKRKEEMKRKNEEMKLNKLISSAAEAGVPLYTKLTDDDPKLSKLMLIAKSKTKKVKRSHIVLESKRLIKDAIKAGYIPEQVFFSRVKDAADLNLPDITQLYKVSYKVIGLWSDVTTSPGVIGFLRTPEVDMKQPAEDALPLTIICDNIRDPGNLGTIIRGAAGVGCQKIILTKGCADLWQPKVLRSGAGAHFRTPIATDVEWTDIESHVNCSASIFLADSNMHSLPPTELQQIVPVIPYFSTDYFNCAPIILVIGGETEGLSAESYQFASERLGVRLNIPLSNDVDSLNSGTALSIISFEIRRQFLVKKSGESSELQE